MIIGDEGEAYWRVSDSRSVPPRENRGHWVGGVAGEKVGPDSSKLRARGLAAEWRALLGCGSPTLPPSESLEGRVATLADVIPGVYDSVGQRPGNLHF